MYIAPESPRWLFSKGRLVAAKKCKDTPSLREDEGRESLSWLRGAQCPAIDRCRCHMRIEHLCPNKEYKEQNTNSNIKTLCAISLFDNCLVPQTNVWFWKMTKRKLFSHEQKRQRDFFVMKQKALFSRFTEGPN